jgi:hypothetical protein
MTEVTRFGEEAADANSLVKPIYHVVGPKVDNGGGFNARFIL